MPCCLGKRYEHPARHRNAELSIISEHSKNGRKESAGIDRRPQISHILTEDPIKIGEQLERSELDLKIILLASANLTTELRLEAIHELGRSGGKIQSH